MYGRQLQQSCMCMCVFQDLVRLVVVSHDRGDVEPPYFVLMLSRAKSNGGSSASSSVNCRGLCFCDGGRLDRLQLDYWLGRCLGGAHSHIGHVAGELMSSIIGQSARKGHMGVFPFARQGTYPLADQSTLARTVCPHVQVPPIALLVERRRESTRWRSASRWRRKEDML